MVKGRGGICMMTSCVRAAWLYRSKSIEKNLFHLLSRHIEMPGDLEQKDFMIQNAFGTMIVGLFPSKHYTMKVLDRDFGNLI
jgi:hypothetical protein